MYVCTTDEMTVTFSSIVLHTIPLTPSLCKSIVVPYVDTNAKVTNFFPFCTNGISMYQKCILPYFIIPSTFSPQASSPLSHHRQTDKSQHPFAPYFFFSLSAWGPTRRRNSTGLAELWGGWPIELESGGRGGGWGCPQNNQGLRFGRP
jgi:hypothetical protein